MSLPRGLGTRFLSEESSCGNVYGTFSSPSKKLCGAHPIQRCKTYRKKHRRGNSHLQWSRRAKIIWSGSNANEWVLQKPLKNAVLEAIFKAIICRLVL